MKDNVVVLLGEITTKAKLNFKEVVADVAKKIGYDEISKGMHMHTYHSIIYASLCRILQALTTSHSN